MSKELEMAQGLRTPTSLVEDLALIPCTWQLTPSVTPVSGDLTLSSGLLKHQAVKGPPPHVTSVCVVCVCMRTHTTLLYLYLLKNFLL